MSKVDEAAKLIWDYMILDQAIRPADVIVVLCSYNTLVARYAADLYTQGIAPIG